MEKDNSPSLAFRFKAEGSGLNPFNIKSVNLPTQLRGLLGGAKWGNLKINFVPGGYDSITNFNQGRQNIQVSFLDKAGTTTRKMDITCRIIAVEYDLLDTFKHDSFGYSIVYKVSNVKEVCG